MGIFRVDPSPHRGKVVPALYTEPLLGNAAQGILFHLDGTLPTTEEGFESFVPATR